MCTHPARGLPPEPLTVRLHSDHSAGELPRVVSLLNSGSNEQTVAMLKVLKGICTNSKLRV